MFNDILNLSLHSRTGPSPNETVTQVFKEPWFVSLCLSILLLAFVGIVVYIYFKRRRTTDKQLGHFNGTNLLLYFSLLY